MGTRPNTPKARRNPTPLKSSPEARRLIAIALRRHKTYEAATRALGIDNRGSLYKMAVGTLHDTPRMRIAIKRANDRARRAWRMERPINPEPVMDVTAVKAFREELRQLLRRIDSIIPK